jgi:DNA adenine methylase
MAIRRRKRRIRHAPNQPSLFPSETEPVNAGMVQRGNGCAGTKRLDDGMLPLTAGKVVVPPIKCQGIKTKLVHFIAESIRWEGKGRWLEPFLGSGVVLFTIRPERALVADTNKHIIGVYSQIQAGTIDEQIVRDYLHEAGQKLAREGADYYYRVRDTFNAAGSPLDFIFLSRACFNGVMRFNKKGGFNVPFCKKPNRFSSSYITKICNQVKRVRQVVRGREWEFRTCTWQTILREAADNDFVYCDPPYIGRHTDYYNSWSDEDATLLARAVKGLPCGFAVSMWQENKYRANPHLAADWADCVVKSYAHFYHVGSLESLRNKMTEALIVRPGFAAQECACPAS